jgi:shikimate kinase
MIVYLLGFMGSGKSTAGKKLASVLDWKFIDLDKEIERQSGRLIHDIFAEENEEFFRKIETDVLKSLSFNENIIISCGGGTPCFNSNMDFMLKNGLTVYLKMTPDQLKSRLVNSHSIRPLIKKIDKDDLLTFISDSLETREKWYNLSEIIVSGADLNIISLKEIILKKLIF